MDSQLTFWRWFDAHQDELFDFEIDQERIFDDLSEQLIRVHPKLTFEFGPKADRREFCNKRRRHTRSIPSSLLSRCSSTDARSLAYYRL